MLRGLKEHAARVFEKQVRIGRPMVLPGFAEDHNPCIYSVVLGMVKIHSSMSKSSKPKISYNKTEDGVFSKMIRWLKASL
jgi:cell division ATPase FtsA